MTMYEMYPDAWPTPVTHRHAPGADDKPRRRVRKEHSVMPAVLVRAAENRSTERSE
jgi:hypothetical protein